MEHVLVVGAAAIGLVRLAEEAAGAGGFGAFAFVMHGMAISFFFVVLGVIDGESSACGVGMGGVYKFKPFARYARRVGISDAMLGRAAREVAAGRIDADLGGGVVKQRVARIGEGRSGGFRTIVLFRSGTNLFFVRGFAKNEQDNITLAELLAFKTLSTRVLVWSEADIAVALSSGAIVKIENEG